LASIARLHPDENAWRGDYAKAGAIRISLVGSGAVTVEVEDGQRRYRRAAEFPDLADVADGGPGSSRYNDQLRALSAAEEAAMQHHDRAAQEAHQQGREDLRAFIAEVTAPLRDEIAELREALRALRADLADTRE
jgi:hypothetical protein